MKNTCFAAIAAAALLAPISASAEHLDVIAMEMTGACTFGEVLTILKDFNAWGEGYGYAAKISAPLQADDLTTYYWLGTSANAAKFGAAWDAWRDGQTDPKSAPAKLQARFDKCTKNKRRTGYDVY
jgi:hypothetical protein